MFLRSHIPMHVFEVFNYAISLTLRTSTQHNNITMQAEHFVEIVRRHFEAENMVVLSAEDDVQELLGIVEHAQLFGKSKDTAFDVGAPDIGLDGLVMVVPSFVAPLCTLFHCTQGDVAWVRGRNEVG